MKSKPEEWPERKCVTCGKDFKGYTSTCPNCEAVEPTFEQLRLAGRWLARRKAERA